MTDQPLGRGPTLEFSLSQSEITFFLSLNSSLHYPPFSHPKSLPPPPPPPPDTGGANTINRRQAFYIVLHSICSIFCRYNPPTKKLAFFFFIPTRPLTGKAGLKSCRPKLSVKIEPVKMSSRISDLLITQPPGFILRQCMSLHAVF